MTDKQLYRFSVACGVVTGVLILFALQPSVDHDAEAQQMHCQMIALWENSQGEFGWPDYNNTGDQCHAIR
jgi:hypothetical protein